MLIRKATKNAAAAITGIYNYYIKNTPITFEIKTIRPSEIAGRMKGQFTKFPWLVGVLKGKLSGMLMPRNSRIERPINIQKN